MGQSGACVGFLLYNKHTVTVEASRHNWLNPLHLHPCEEKCRMILMRGCNDTYNRELGGKQLQQHEENVVVAPYFVSS